MISGRGLGHTGGTLDKMEAIPGVVTEVPEDRFRAMVADIGCAIVSASGNLAPADKRLYAIRDVTSTVESIDLITASILSKKLAAGLDALVLDVKAGSGAFMATMDEARALARSLVDTANGAGCRTTALLTDMNEPLAPSVGNAVEVADCMEALTGGASDTPLVDLTIDLCATLLRSCGAERDEATARARLRETLTSGAAADRFGRMVAALGGPSDFVERWRDRLPQAPVILDVPAGTSGHVAAIDGRAMGMAVVRMGGGRLKGGDPIDPAVGLTRVARLGAKVAPGDPLFRLHARDAASAEAARAAVLAAITIGEAPAPRPLVLDRIG
jgi:thymidine phosphorylase